MAKLFCMVLLGSVAAVPAIAAEVFVPPEACRPVTGAGVLERLLPEARDRVGQIDLRALGLGEFAPRGFARPTIPAPLEVFIDGEALLAAE